MKVVALAGGVGGAKLAHGLAMILPATDLTIIVNTGDDFEHLGLKISPDLDTVCYTLAGIANPETGWGRVDETWNAIDCVSALGGPGWFKLGDRDLGTHLERSRRLRQGQSLSQITREFCEYWGIKHIVLPMSNDPVPTIVFSSEGALAFQDYFVRKNCQPPVESFQFLGSEKAAPAPGIISAISDADLLVVCPSNPWVSINPILSLPEIKRTIVKQRKSGMKAVAVSPIIGGQAIKGPLAKMYRELGMDPSALTVAEHYSNLVDYFVMDFRDLELVEAVKALQVSPIVLQTIMNSIEDRRRLAEEIVSKIREIEWR